MRLFSHIECPKCGHIVYDEVEEHLAYMARLREDLKPFMDAVTDLGGHPVLIETHRTPRETITQYVPIDDRDDVASFVTWLMRRGFAQDQYVWFSDFTPLINDTGWRPGTPHKWGVRFEFGNLPEERDDD